MDNELLLPTWRIFCDNKYMATVTGRYDGASKFGDFMVLLLMVWGGWLRNFLKV